MLRRVARRHVIQRARVSRRNELLESPDCASCRAAPEGVEVRDDRVALEPVERVGLFDLEVRRVGFASANAPRTARTSCMCWLGIETSSESAVRFCDGEMTCARFPDGATAGAAGLGAAFPVSLTLAGGGPAHAHTAHTAPAPGVRVIELIVHDAQVDRVGAERHRVAHRDGVRPGEHALQLLILGIEIDDVAREREWPRLVAGHLGAARQTHRLLPLVDERGVGRRREVRARDLHVAAAVDQAVVVDEHRFGDDGHRRRRLSRRILFDDRDRRARDGAHLIVRPDARRGVEEFRLRPIQRRPARQPRVHVSSGGDAIFDREVVEKVRREMEARLVVRRVADHLIVIGKLLRAVAAERDAAGGTLDDDAPRSAPDVEHLADARK